MAPGQWNEKQKTQANWIIVYMTLPDKQGWIFQMYHIMLTSKLGVYFNGDAWLCTAQQRLILQNRCLITCHATRSDLSIVKSFVFIIRHWVFFVFFFGFDWHASLLERPSVHRAQVPVCHDVDDADSSCIIISLEPTLLNYLSGPNEEIDEASVLIFNTSCTD